MSGSSKRKNYTPAYRCEAAHLVIDNGRPTVKVAREVGVVRPYWAGRVAYERAKADHPPEAFDVDERAELGRLRIRMPSRGWTEFSEETAAFLATENHGR